MRSMTPGRLSRRRLRSGCDLLHPVSFLVGVGIAFLPLAIRVVVDGTLKYVCHPPRLLRSSGACLLVSFMGALKLGVL